MHASYDHTYSRREYVAFIRDNATHMRHVVCECVISSCVNASYSDSQMIICAPYQHTYSRREYAAFIRDNGSYVRHISKCVSYTEPIACAHVDSFVSVRGGGSKEGNAVRM